MTPGGLRPGGVMSERLTIEVYDEDAVLCRLWPQGGPRGEVFEVSFFCAAETDDWILQRGTPGQGRSDFV